MPATGLVSSGSSPEPSGGSRPGRYAKLFLPIEKSIESQPSEARSRKDRQQQTEEGRDGSRPFFNFGSLASVGEIGPALLLKTGSKCAIFHVVFSAC
jgi:hypothetical protein